MTNPDENAKDWIETIARFAGALGLSPVKVRWKLMGLKERWSSRVGQGRATAQHIGYQHRICPHCQTLQDRSSKVCVNCGRAMAPRFLEILGRLGIVGFHPASVSSLLSLGIIVCYLRVAIAQGGQGLLNQDADTLVHFGGNLPDAFMEGEWWRLSTYIFLHANLIHILFNLIALQQIGPQIEHVFGRGRMLFFFMLTGIVAGLGSELMGLRGVGIGASGALMGLIGLAAGWGQRDGTAIGKAVRNQMIMWGIFTMAYGFMKGADNAAHGSGFLCGALLGLLCKAQWERKGNGTSDILFGMVGALAALGTVSLVLFPPGSG
ncbi:MAG TPA: rhomboid family intramembrane serine protease [bacterium]|jgi:membrane associated rhomboid family serine protease|nr:rhomboid family intramembrane serine protease [bacterium]